MCVIDTAISNLCYDMLLFDLDLITYGCRVYYVNTSVLYRLGIPCDQNSFLNKATYLCLGSEGLQLNKCKASKNKCLVSHLHPHLFQVPRIQSMRH